MEENSMEHSQVTDEVAVAIESDWDAADAAPPADQPERDEADEIQEDEFGYDGENAADQPDVFTLKHLDEVKSVGRDEVVQLAQKGLDYDRIRTDRDKLRTAAEKSNATAAVVETYAERSGMTVEEYLGFCREQELMAGGATEHTAKAKVQEERRQADFRAFFSAHPDVKPDTIPGEVWAMVREGVPLLTAYTKHENQWLKMELEAERKNRGNAARSTGSQNTSGEQSADPYSEGWDD